MLNKLKNLFFLIRARRHNCFLSMYIYITIKTIRKYPITWFYKILKNIFYSYINSFKIHGFSILPKVIFDMDVFPIEIFVYKKIPFNSDYKFSFIFQNFFGGKTVACISVEKNAILHIENTFYIGNGVRIVVHKNAELVIRGMNKNGSGITCDSIILTHKKIVIGFDTIISWNVYITDCSQHKINSFLKIGDIEIGNNVWLSEGVTISYGTKVGNGSIVGSKSFLNSSYEDNTLIVGTPAKIKKYDIYWEK